MYNWSPLSCIPGSVPEQRPQVEELHGEASKGEELAADGEVDGPALMAVPRDAAEAPVVDVVAEAAHVRPAAALFLGLHGQDLGAQGVREVDGRRPPVVCGLRLSADQGADQPCEC